VNHCVAVRTNGPKIRDRVEFVLLSHLAEWTKMVDVNKALPQVAVHRLEVEAAGGAVCPVVLETTSAGSGVAFICIDGDLLLRTLDICLSLGDLLRRTLRVRLGRLIEAPTDLDRHFVLGDPGR